jgi:phosphoenolpyruvate synthase/pyruvate phosphate dikinase
MLFRTHRLFRLHRVSERCGSNAAHHEPRQEFERLQPGDVLIAPVTTPVWTLLFSQAVAVVTDTGSPLAHASLAAREYGIPAVVGTANATGRLQDGQWVLVDGTSGQVFFDNNPTS